MIWIVFAFSAAFFQSTTDALSKHGLKHLDENIIAWALKFFAVLFLIPLFFWFKVPVLGKNYFLALMIGGSLNVVALILYVKAIKISDLSLSIPMIAFTPLFLLLTSPVLVGEFPKLTGIIGVFLIITGSFILNFNDKQKHYLAPLKAIFIKPGPRLMLIVAFIWSITSNFDKIGIRNSSPLFWGFSTYSFMSVAMIPFILYYSKNPIKQIKQKIRFLFIIGLSSAINIFLYMLAIKLTLVVNVVSIVRTSALISVLFGIIIFKEKGFKEKVIGTLIMLAGVFFITML